MSTKKLLQKYTPAEIADSFIITEKVPVKQRNKADSQFREARKKKQAEMSEKDKLILRLMQFKFQVEDYLETKDFDPKRTFSFFLKEYVGLLNKKRRHFAQEIDIGETELSQLINQHRLPNDNIIVRLEIHSNNSIPAVTWYRLVVKEKEYLLKTNKLLRQRERKFVKNKLTVSI